MKKTMFFALLGTVSAAASTCFFLACNGDSSQNDGGTDSGPADTSTDTGNKDSGGGDAGDAGFPTPPTLKTQIDRMGRPAVATALIHAFDPTKNLDGGAGGIAKDTYNADGTVAGWVAAWAPEMAKNLAILDALDTDGGVGSGCGNQLAYSASTHYQTLSGLFADDRLYIDTSKSTCAVYLGVELNATTIFPNTDCGGRGLKYDVIKITYSAAAIGAISGVTDGVTADATKTGGTTFPYLQPAQ